MLLLLSMEESAAYRDRVSHLYLKSRCGNKEAYNELESLASPTFHQSREDALVAKGYLGDLLLICNSQLIPRDERRGKELLSELSHLDRGDLTCYHLQHLLGIYYQDCCSGMETESVELFQQAADQGHAMSISTLGYFYDYGTGVRKNKKTAFSLYATAANKGYPVAQCNVGKCYDSGQGCEEDSILAGEWFQKAAEQGYVDALFNMGIFHQIGRGCEVNYVKAVQYFELAALQGDSSAQYNLAWCYHNGKGLSRDDGKAVEWCLLAARQGDCMAAMFLGIAYESGWSVEVNVVEAMRYFRQAEAGKDEQCVAYAAKQILELTDAYKEAVSNALIYLHLVLNDMLKL